MGKDQVIGAAFVIIGVLLFLFSRTASNMIQDGFRRYYNVEHSSELSGIMIRGMGLFALGLGLYFCFVGLN